MMFPASCRWIDLDIAVIANSKNDAVIIIDKIRNTKRYCKAINPCFGADVENMYFASVFFDVIAYHCKDISLTLGDYSSAELVDYTAIRRVAHE